MLKIPLQIETNWKVIFVDDKRWQVGVYVPKFNSIKEVEWLECHDAPELFLLVRGSVVLVTSSDGKGVVETRMEPGIIYIVDEWHNAYRPEGLEGVTLVVEKTGIKTEFLNIK